MPLGLEYLLCYLLSSKWHSNTKIPRSWNYLPWTKLALKVICWLDKPVCRYCKVICWLDKPVCRYCKVICWLDNLFADIVYSESFVVKVFICFAISCVIFRLITIITICTIWFVLISCHIGLYYIHMFIVRLNFFNF